MALGRVPSNCEVTLLEIERRKYVNTRDACGFVT